VATRSPPRLVHRMLLKLHYSLSHLKKLTDMQSAAFNATMPDGSLFLFAPLVASVKPLYTNQPAYRVKYVYADEKKNTNFWKKCGDTKSVTLTDGGASVDVGGMAFRRNAATNSYVLSLQAWSD
jgi:hypothetical protein